MPSIDSILKMYRSSKREIKVRAGKMLLDRSSDVSTLVLLDILENLSRDGLGAKTQKELRKRQEPYLCERMMQYLSTEDDFLRETACHILGDTRDEKYVESLTNHLNDPAYMVRRAALHALEKIGTDSAKEALGRKLAALEQTGDSTDMKFWLEYGLSKWRSMRLSKMQSEEYDEDRE